MTLEALRMTVAGRIPISWAFVPFVGSVLTYAFMRRQS